MKSFDEVMCLLMKERSLGAGFSLREVTRWTVHCSHCGIQLIGDTPQTEKAWQALKRSLEGRVCRNLQCVSNGGAERVRAAVVGPCGETGETR